MGISYRKLIDAKCKDCVYDPLDVGNWRQQTGDCRVVSCPLHEVRPKSKPRKQGTPNTATKEAEKPFIPSWIKTKGKYNES